MNRDEIIALMKSSKSEVEWNANCDKVKVACGGYYPDFWYSEVIQSGLCARVSARWGGNDQIRISAVD